MRLLNSSRSPNQYKIFKSSLDLQIFIGDSSRDSVGLLHHLSQCKKLEYKICQSKKGKVGIGDNSRAGCDGSKFDKIEMDNVEVNGGKVGDDEVEKKVQKTSKSKNLSKSKKTVGPLSFFIPGVKLAFTKLKQVFLKALIFYHFDLECHIRIEIDELGYAISGVFSQLTLDDLC